MPFLCSLSVFFRLETDTEYYLKKATVVLIIVVFTMTDTKHNGMLGNIVEGGEIMFS